MKTQAEIVIKAKAYAESIGNKDGLSAYDYVMGYNQCQEDMADEIIKLEEKLKLIEHIADEMAKDLIEQSKFFDGGFESVSKYYNYKQSLNKQD